MNQLNITTSLLDSNGFIFLINTKKISNYQKDFFENQQVDSKAENVLVNKIESEFVDSIFRDKKGRETLRKIYNMRGGIVPFYMDGMFQNKFVSPNTLISIQHIIWENDKIVSTKSVSYNSEIETFISFDQNERVIK